MTKIRTPHIVPNDVLKVLLDNSKTAQEVKDIVAAEPYYFPISLTRIYKLRAENNCRRPRGRPAKDAA
jgi:hypothetical protein